MDYRSSTVRPADFDAFWADVMAAVDKLPLNATAEPLPERSTEAVEVFDVRYDSLDGVRIAGWYCLPRAAERPLPGLLIVPGYISEPTLPKSWAKLGYAALGIGPRGKLRSNARYNPGYPGLLIDNIVDRHTYAYRGFYVDAARGIDFLLGRPEVDQQHIGIHGSSQGGALTITTSALRNDVVACGAAGAPYLCGFMDAARLTHSYPYEEINEYLRQYPERRAAVAETLNYFDGINFAPRIRCPMLVYVGLRDDVCPPETGFALYDALTSPKDLHTYEGCAHDAGSYWQGQRVQAFLAEHLQPASSLARV
ncbi:MAG TPA: acetylxylan esterase [Chloroflexota bacterium]|jgi:cephalosporin-C deacetylase|nr:acetylxylan esterase [Chloroflexota bacterium]